MARPVLALLTDFGIQDHYVAAMKGVILGICPDAAIVDITHDVPPQDIATGALELDAVIDYFPIGAVFVCVVDPGVGTSRRGIAVAAGDRLFVGPDNGLLSRSWQRDPGARVVEITNHQFTLGTVSRTFEGRDRFAPAAAWLATGIALERLGAAVADPLTLHSPVPQIDLAAASIAGAVVRVDRFGNLVTNIDSPTLAQVAAPYVVRVGAAQIDGIGQTYADVRHGALCALVGSTGHLEIAVSGGSAAAILGVGRQAPVHVRGRSAA
jgi:S-adenosylmethionine hydrolase